MSETRDGSGQRRAPRWMKLLLVLSLLANAAVIGIAVGSKMRGGWRHGEDGLSRQQARILHMVPDVRRAEARAILMSRKDEIRAARDAMRAAQAELAAAIRRDPYSPDEIAAVLDRRQAASSQVWGIRYQQFAEIAAMLNATERSELATRLEERTRKWMKRQEGRRQ